MKRTIKVEVELTIHEPDHDDEGRATSTIFLMYGGGQYTFEGQDHLFGCSGGRLVAYLPDSCAVSIGASDVIEAGLVAIGKQLEGKVASGT